MVKIESVKQSFGLKLPTSLSEITPEYLNHVTNHINLASNHALIALVLTTKLSEYCYTLNNNGAKQPEVGVTPIIVKYNASEDVNVSFNNGEIAIISNTDLERAYHVKAPSIITSDRVADYLLSDDSLRKSIQIGDLKDSDGNRIGDRFVKLLQFKIVPVCDIHGSFNPISSISDEFAEAYPDAQ